MRKKNIPGSLFIFIAFFALPKNVCAHTISQHLEALYGEIYLPLFILSNLLPFIGLGILSNYQKLSNFPVNDFWIFTIGLLMGSMTSFAFDNLSFFFVINNSWIFVLGALLLLLPKPARRLTRIVYLISGISLGYEFASTIAHAQEFTWLFISLLLSGLIIFVILIRIKFHQKNISNAIRISTGLFLVVAGLIVLLLT